VQSIIRELRGEKIDIIEYSEEITTFAEKALQPAKVSRVTIADLNEKQLEVIVDDTQLSLAIGKKGQNVRLAAKLLGWKIDIKSEEEKRQEVEQQMQGFSGGATTPIEQVTELGEQIIEKLVAAGITTVEALADMTPEQLEEVPGIGERTLEKISAAVRHYFGQYAEGEAAPVPEEGTTVASEDEGKAGTEAGMAAGTEAAAAGTGVDLTESSVYGKDDVSPADGASAAAVDRLETLTGGAEAETEPTAGATAEELNQLNAETAEEIDALTVNLQGGEDMPNAKDGSGRVVDDTAEERMAELTETGPMLDGDGAESLTPGRDDTSAVLVEHHPDTAIAGLDAVVEGNVEETRDERKEDAKVDEGGA
jgi:N utilization substance protein A